MVGKRTRDRGYVLWDVLIAATVLGIAVLAFLRMIPSTAQLESSAREREVAAEHLASKWEELYAIGVADGFALFNEVTEDDPEGPGTGPGPVFDVPGFEPLQAGGAVGRIELPAHAYDQALGVIVRETDTDTGLGLPRDLDGDGAITNSVPAANLKIIPARIVLEWKGPSGRQRIEAVVILGKP